MSDKALLTRLEQLEQALFGGKVEEKCFEEETTTKILLDDALEKIIFFILLEIALEGRIGATSALVAEMTDTTKNTVKVRLERLIISCSSNNSKSGRRSCIISHFMNAYSAPLPRS